MDLEDSDNAPPEDDSAVGGAARDAAEDKRLRRLERNRESARQSRLRKKQHLNHLQEEVDSLAEELGSCFVSNGKQIETLLAHKRKELLQRALAIVAGRASSALSPEEMVIISRAVDYCVNVAGPNSVERRLIRKGRFDALRRLLLGPATSILALLAYSFTGAPEISESAAMAGAGASSSGTGSAKGSSSNSRHTSPHLGSVCAAWWASLCQEIPLSREQADTLRDRLCEAAKSPEAASGSYKLDALLAHITGLEAAISENNGKAQQELEAFKRILDPLQMLKLLAWMYFEEDEKKEPVGVGEEEFEYAAAGTGAGAGAMPFPGPAALPSEGEPLMFSHQKGYY